MLRFLGGEKMKPIGILSTIISIILAVSLLFTSLPINSYADLQEPSSQEDIGSSYDMEEESDPEEITSEPSITDDEDDDPGMTLEVSDISGEDETLREEASKQFLMTNGDHLLVSYETTVHYPAADGSWKEIDNTLVKTAGDKEDPLERYETTEGPVRYAFAAETEGKDDYLVKAARGEASLRFSLEGEKNSANAELLEKEKKEKGSLSEFLEAEKASAGIRYEEILPETDLAYTVTGPDLKEQIVIRKQQETYEYRFRIDLSGMTVEEAEDEAGDKCYHFIEEESEEVLFTMPAMYLFDSMGHVSDGVVTELEELEEPGSFLLTITADADWMNAEERAFPVTLDPTLESRSTSTGSESRIV